MTNAIRPGVATSLLGNGEVQTWELTGITDEGKTEPQEVRHAGRATEKRWRSASGGW